MEEVLLTNLSHFLKATSIFFYFYCTFYKSMYESLTPILEKKKGK